MEGGREEEENEEEEADDSFEEEDENYMDKEEETGKEDAEVVLDICQFTMDIILAPRHNWDPCSSTLCP